MAVMLGAMAFMRRIDQEEPQVLQYARMAYMVYIVITTTVYFLLHIRIVSRRDVTPVTVPIGDKPPSFSDAMAAAKGEMEKAAAEAEKAADGGESSDSEEEDSDKDGEEEKDGDGPQEDSSKEEEGPKEEVITTMEYDLRILASSRKSWLTNACLLAAVHYKMESVSPLVVSSLMGLMRLVADDPLVQIHLRGEPSVGKFARPFKQEKSPIAGLMKEFAAKTEEAKEETQTERSRRRIAPSGEPEDLHDDGDSEEDESPPPAIDDLKDDHIKSDFDDDVAQESKKTK